MISSHFKLQVDRFQIATHAKPIKSESFPDRNEVRILYFVTAVEESLFCHGTKMLMCCGDDRKSGFVNEDGKVKSKSRKNRKKFLGGGKVGGKQVV